MKKVLLVLGVAIAFAACSSTNDCICTVDMGPESGAPAEVPMPEFDGKCSEINYADLDASWSAEWEQDWKLSCVDK